MDRSRFAPDGKVTAPLTHGLLRLLPDLGEPADTVDWSNGESWAGGGMVSTLDDLHAWGEALGEGAGVTPELQAARYADVASIPGQAGAAYGLGTGIEFDAETGCIRASPTPAPNPGTARTSRTTRRRGRSSRSSATATAERGDAATEVLKALAPLLRPVLNGSPTEPCAAPWG